MHPSSPIRAKRSANLIPFDLIAYRILVRKHEGKNQLRYKDVDGRISKLDDTVGWIHLAWNESRYGCLVNGMTKVKTRMWEYLYQISDYVFYGGWKRLYQFNSTVREIIVIIIIIISIIIWCQ